MNRTILSIIVLALVAAPLTGCIENMRDLKDKLEPAATEVIDNESLDLDETPATNATNTTPPKPPVARITIFGANNALVFKASFVGEDAESPIFVAPDTELTLLSADSEAVETGATIAGASWSIDGKVTEGAKATATFAEAGLYTVTLTVVDSVGTTDTQTVPVAVAPVAYDVESKVTTGPMAGVLGNGQTGEATFDLTTKNEPTPVKITGVKFVASPLASCDHMLAVYDAEGNAVAGPTDGAGPGEAEELSAGSLPEGTYTIVVDNFACVAPEGAEVVIIVTYLPVIEGLGEADGHGGHAH